MREVKGKVWQPPPKPEKIEVESEEKVETEWDEALAGASEEDIVELAAILGYTGLVNQIQFYATQKKYGKEEVPQNIGGWRAVAKSAKLKVLPFEPDNQTDVEESIAKIKQNDPSLTSLNLNNIKNISYEKMNHLLNAMKENTNLTTLSMCNIDMPDAVGQVITIIYLILH